MEKIAVITDSCADIPPELIQKYGIFVLPLIIRTSDGREYRDGVDITANEVYELLHREIPKTSLPSAQDAEALFQRLKDSGYTHAIAIMLSSGLSGTANMMRVVSQQFPQLEVAVFDSLSGSIGCGINALEAAAAAERGESFDAIVARVPSLLKNTHVFFSVDTLEYLMKGGRIGKITALAGTVLNIKPIVSFMPDGQLGSVEKVRGDKMLKDHLCSQVKQHLRPGCRYNLLVADGGNPEGGAELQKKLGAMFPDYEQYIYVKIDATLSCYIGPGVLGAGIQILEN